MIHRVALATSPCLRHSVVLRVDSSPASYMSDMLRHALIALCSILGWAARAHLSEEDGELKMDFYQVYLVSSMLEAFYIHALIKLLGYCRYVEGKINLDIKVHVTSHALHCWPHLY